jgi:hypothetical protein
MCGQKFWDGPLTVARLWHQMVKVFFDLERGFLYTMRKMVVGPGEVARRYLDGERRRFISPMAYFLIAITGLIVSYELNEARWIQQMVESMNAFGEEPGDRMQGLQELGFASQREYAEYAFNLTKKYYTYYSGYAVLAMALGMHVVFRDRTLAEWLAVALFTWAQITFYVTIIQFATLRMGMWVNSIAGFLVQAVVVAWTLSAFGDRRWRSAIVGLLGTYASILVMSAILGAALVGIMVGAESLGYELRPGPD